MFYVGSLNPDSKTPIPTVTDNLFTQGTISEHQVSVSFEPITDSSGTQMNGEITWGVYIYYLKP
jgi:cathepsin E